MKKTTKILGAAVLLLTTTIAAESFALTVTTTNDANTLANTIAGSGVTITSASYTGAAGASGTFTGGLASGIGFNTGILLTSGKATGAEGPNNATNYTVNNGLGGDAQLNSLIPGYSTHDATSLNLNFTTSGGDLYFNYVFGSEEYNEYVGTSYNDVFGFFINGVNIAKIPGTDTNVAINNVNLGSNSTYYNNNPGTYSLQYDGFTDVFTAKMLGLGAGEYSIKLAIADAGDWILDSGVFIQAGTFSDTETPPVPEPSTFLLLGAGLGGFALWRRRNQK